MDVHCSTCNEPWDAHHLRHDAVFETNLSHEEASAWGRLPTSKQLSSRYREMFKVLGWEFGRSMLNVIRCPACPPDAKPNRDRVELKGALEDVLGGDEDGFASTLDELGL